MQIGGNIFWRKSSSIKKDVWSTKLAKLSSRKVERLNPGSNMLLPTKSTWEGPEGKLEQSFDVISDREPILPTGWIPTRQLVDEGSSKWPRNTPIDLKKLSHHWGFFGPDFDREANPTIPSGQGELHRAKLTQPGLWFRFVFLNYCPNALKEVPTYLPFLSSRKPNLLPRLNCVS